MYKNSFGLFVLAVTAAWGQRQPPVPQCACARAEALEASREGFTAHQERRLKEASENYDDALKLEPARDASAYEMELILRFAPRIYTTPNEPFGLKDVAAIMHPSQPWIAYHLFWEDDIDFPDDNDPCDHEVVWVRLDAERKNAVAVYTYFHGRILTDSRPGPGRPRVVTQWGKHGTMPWDWKAIQIEADWDDVERNRLAMSRPVTLEEYNRATYQKLFNVGREHPASPLARGWPVRFEGKWEDFTRFTRLVDPLVPLRKNGLTAVSCLNNAVINRRFLRYNFAAKVEWPQQLCEREPASSPSAAGAGK